MSTAAFSANVSRYRSALMGLAMLSIMLFHQRFVSVFPFNAFLAFGHWAVDIFLFLSGMGMVRSLETHGTRRFYRRRLRRLLPVCVFCGTLKYIVFLAVGSPIRNLEVGLNLGPWSVFSLDLWFVYAILVYYLLSPLFCRFLKSAPLQTLLSAYAFSVLMSYAFSERVGYDWLNPLGITLYTAERLPVFLLGMLTAMHADRISARHFRLSMCAFVAAAVLALSLKAGVVPDVLTALVYPLLSLGVLSVLSLLTTLLPRLHRTVTAALEFVGRLSLEIYLVHAFIFASFMLTLYTKCDKFLLLTASLLLSVLVAWLCRRCVDRLMQPLESTR